MSAGTTAAIAAMAAARARRLAATLLIIREDGIKMDESILREIIGRDIQIYIFNEVGSIKGKLMDSDSDWIKVQTSKGISYVNRLTVNYILVKGDKY